VWILASRLQKILGTIIPVFFLVFLLQTLQEGERYMNKSLLQFSGGSVCVTGIMDPEKQTAKKIHTICGLTYS